MTIGGVTYLFAKDFKGKLSHDVFLDDKNLPVRILVSKKSKKDIKFPIWLITLVQSRDIILKVFHLLKSKSDPIDPNEKLIDLILNELRSIKKDQTE